VAKRSARRAKVGQKGPRPASRDASWELCPNCAETVSSLDRFCPACGTMIPGAEEE
jgi:predicted amidophosphoribosyltransferase